MPRLTAEQDRQVELLRKELTEIEEKMREANENELPEEEYRVAAEGKREELNELMRRFQEVNLEAGGGAAAAGAAGGGPSAAGREKEGERGGEGDERRGSTTKFERPSERRRRLEQKRREERSAGGGRGYHGNRDRYHDNKNNYEGGEDPYASFGGSSRNRHHDSTSGRGYGGEIRRLILTLALLYATMRRVLKDLVSRFCSQFHHSFACVICLDLLSHLLTLELQTFLM